MWSATPSDDSACDALIPSARVDAQAAWFGLPAPVAVGDRDLSRGVVVFGGRSPSGTLLNDLWVYDVAAGLRATSSVCP